MRCIAIEKGYDGTCVRYPSDADESNGKVDIFDMPDTPEIRAALESKDGTWFVEVDDKGNEIKSRKGKPKASFDKSVAPGAGPAKPKGSLIAGELA